MVPIVPSLNLNSYIAVSQMIENVVHPYESDMQYSIEFFISNTILIHSKCMSHINVRSSVIQYKINLHLYYNSP